MFPGILDVAIPVVFTTNAVGSGRQNGTVYFLHSALFNAFPGIRGY